MADKTTSTQKICPTCGTRVSENATRCPVCGRSLSATAGARSGSDQSVRGPRMPEVKLSLPLFLGLLVLLVGLGAGGVYMVTRPTPTLPPGVPTPTLATTPTLTATITVTFTPLPPKEYTVKQGDTCQPIAYTFGVSIPTIIQFNNLDANCTLSVGQKLLIPQPPPT